MAIGHDVFDHLEYDGTFYISSDFEHRRLDDDYAGFVFGYQNNQSAINIDICLITYRLLIMSYINRRFYLCIWKRGYQQYFSSSVPRPTAFRGIQLKV